MAGRTEKLSLGREGENDGDWPQEKNRQMGGGLQFEKGAAVEGKAGK